VRLILEGAGRPFVNRPKWADKDVQSANYWSATTNADNPTFAWSVVFFEGFVFLNVKTNGRLAWCVHGGMNAATY